MTSSRRLRAFIARFAVLVLCSGCEHTPTVLEEACAERGLIVRVGDVRDQACEGSTFIATTEPLRAALAGTAPDALVRALRAARASSLMVELDPRREGATLASRVARADVIEGFRTRVLADGVAFIELYAAPQVLARDASAIARVAREVLAGTPSPTLNQFPASLRAPSPVEVMVFLRDRGAPRFWRSARGGSIASALLLALSVVESRWAERASVMRGPLRAQLPSLDVEVWLLREDGTYADRSRGLIDATLGPAHGVGYEETNRSWQYILPELLGRTHGIAAMNRLFTDNALGDGALDRADLRLYRLVATRIAVSAQPVVRIPPPGLGLIQADDGL